MASAATDLAVRARMPLIGSVWHPYHFQLPTVAGCDGPVDVALAELLEVEVLIVEVLLEEVLEEVLLVEVAPEQDKLPAKVPQVPHNSLAALKASTTTSVPLPL